MRLCSRSQNGVLRLTTVQSGRNAQSRGEFKKIANVTLKLCLKSLYNCKLAENFDKKITVNFFSLAQPLNSHSLQDKGRQCVRSTNSVLPR